MNAPFPIPGAPLSDVQTRPLIAFDDVSKIYPSRDRAAEVVALHDINLARRAFRKYGKGRHPAGLNFGDCFSYALARALDKPLLFKGNDFSQTDIECYPASGSQ